MFWAVQGHELSMGTQCPPPPPLGTLHSGSVGVARSPQAQPQPVQGKWRVPDTTWALVGPWGWQTWNKEPHTRALVHVGGGCVVSREAKTPACWAGWWARPHPGARDPAPRPRLPSLGVVTGQAWVSLWRALPPPQLPMSPPPPACRRRLLGAPPRSLWAPSCPPPPTRSASPASTLGAAPPR